MWYQSDLWAVCELALTVLKYYFDCTSLQKRLL